MAIRQGAGSYRPVIPGSNETFYGPTPQESSSIARGTDYLQASLYATVGAVGSLTGVDIVQKWGEENAMRNLDEAALNPPTIRDWDDVNSLGEFGTYVLEAIGEQLPQLGVDAAVGLAGTAFGGGGGIAGIAARRATMTLLEKAAIGKAMKRKLGEPAFFEFNKRKAMRGAAIGAGISNIAQNAGETQLNFMQRDIDAPGTALLAGVAKGALDSVGPLLLSKMAFKSGAAAADLPELFGRIAKEVGISTGTESATEGMQTLIDHVATRIQDPSFDLTSAESLKEIREAMIKGGIVGGAMGGGISALKEVGDYRREKAGAEDLGDSGPEFEALLRSLMATQDFNGDEEDGEPPALPPPNVPDAKARAKSDLVPESQQTIDAQARAVLDPTSSKNLMEVTKGSPMPSAGILDVATYQIETEQGTAITPDVETAELIEQNGGDEETMGALLYGRPEGKEGTDGTVLVARDRDGNPIAEVATSRATLERDRADLLTQVPAGGSLHVTTADQVLADRTALAAKESVATKLVEPEPVVEPVTPVKPAKKPTPEVDRAGYAAAMREVIQQRYPGGEGLAEATRLLRMPKAQLSTVERRKATKLRNQLHAAVNVNYLAAAATDADVDGAIVDRENEDLNYEPTLDAATSDAEDRISEATTADDPLITEIYGEGDTREQSPWAGRDIGVEERQGDDIQIESRYTPIPGVPRPPKGQNYPPRTLSVFTEHALENSIERGRIANRMEASKKYSEEERRAIHNTVIQLVRKGENGKPQYTYFHVPQLTSAGRDILKATGVSSELSEDQWYLQGFLTMLAELRLRGYEIPNSMKGLLREHGQGLIVHSTRDHKNGTGKTVTLRQLIRGHQATQREQTNNQPDRDEARWRELRQMLGMGTNKKRHPNAPAPRSPDEQALMEEYEQLDRQRAYLVAGGGLDNPSSENDTSTELSVDEARAIEQGGTDRTAVTMGGNRARTAMPRVAPVVTPNSTPQQPTLAQSADQKYDQGLVTATDKKFDASGASLAENSQAAARTVPSTDKPKPTPSVRSDKGELTKSVRGYGKVDKKDVNLVRGILDEIGLSELVMVIGDVESIEDLFLAGEITAEEMQALEKAFEDPSVKAQFVPKGRTGVIVIRNETNAEGGRQNRLAILGHEVGHGVYNTIEDKILNPSTDREIELAKRLKAAFEEDKNSDRSYAAKAGFKEWFADKISARALGIIRNNEPGPGKRTAEHRKIPVGIVEKFFQSSAELLHKTFQVTKGMLHPRFHENMTFAHVIDAYKESNVFANVKSFGKGKMESFNMRNIPISAIANHPNVRRLGAALWKNRDPRAWIGFKHLFDAHSRIIGMGQKFIADQIYKQTNTKNSTAYWDRVDLEFQRYVAKVYTVFHINDSAAVRARVFDQLARELPDNQLTPRALAMRNVMREFHQYLKKAIPNIGELQDYFPRDYNIIAIQAKAARFVEVLQMHGLSLAEANGVFENLVAARDYNSPEAFLPKQSHLHQHRQLNNADLIRQLVEEDFLNTNPEHALISYIRKSVRRAELERKWGGYKFMEGWTKYERVAKMSPADQQAATARNNLILQTYLMSNGWDLQVMSQQQAVAEAIAQKHAQIDAHGNITWRHPSVHLDTFIEKLRMPAKKKAELKMLIISALDIGTPLDPNSMSYNLTGEMRAYEALRTLLFSGIASVPEVGAVFARNKGALNAGEFARVVMDAIKNYDDAKEFAEAMGAIQRDISDTILQEMNMDVQRGKYRLFRRVLPAMFKLNGNDAIVHFSRVVGASIARQFILSNASKAAQGDARAVRYLQELELSAADVLLWASGPAGPTADTVTPNIQDAINRFVNESVIRPNAAERPTWTKTPLGGLIFNLKTFSYSYSKNIVGGLIREGEARYAEGDRYAMLPYYLAVVGVFLAFGALGDEIRQRIKSLGEKGTFANADSDVGTMLNTWVDRTGLTAMPFVDAWSPGGPPMGSDIAFALGPSASHFYDLFLDGALGTGDMLRSIPIISQVNALRAGIKDRIE